MKILASYQRRKEDETDDEFFYANPRFVYHLDENFRKYLTHTYEDEISNNSSILDLMSSWDSFLPKTKTYKTVIGHGLNNEELKRNSALDRYWIQNFNKNQIIPIKNETIDYCLMVAAWQYLQYPEKLSLEISRILKSKGKLIISFTNRAFWSKAPYIWTNSSEEERINYVKEIIVSNGFQKPKIIRRFINQNSLFPFLNKDPFYCLIACKKVD